MRSARISAFRWRSVGRLLAVLAGVASCERTVLTAVDLPIVPGQAVVWLVALDSDRRVVRMSEALGLDEGRVIFGQAPVFETEPGEEELLVLTLRAGALHADRPGYEVDRADEIVAEIQPPPDEPRLEVQSDFAAEWSVGPLPDDLEVAKVEGVDGPSGGLSLLAINDARVGVLRRAITLRVPVDAEYCRNPSAGELVPFAGEENALAGGALDGRVVAGAASLDADRLVVAVGDGIAVVRRGQPTLSDGLDSYLPIGGGFNYRRVAVDRTADSQGRYRVLALGQNRVANTDRLYETRLTELWLTDAGFLTQTRTATTVFESKARSVSIDADGAFIAAFDDGVVYRGRRASEVLDFKPLPNDQEVRVDSSRAVATGDARLPWVVSSTNRLFLYEAAFDNWLPSEFSVDLGDQLDFSAIAVVGDLAGGIWAGSKPDVVVRYTGGRWEPIQIRFPPRLFACTGVGTMADPRVVKGFTDGAAAGGYVYFVVETCNTIVEIRATAPHCTALVRSPLATPALADGYFEGTHVFGGELFAYGSAGRVLSMRVAD